jgi:Uma2 family endonuclease
MQMRTLVLDPTPAEIDRLRERRRRSGADRRDEVWEGVYHMVPAPSAAHSLVAAQLAVLLAAPARAVGLTVSADFNLGSEADYRVPDLGVHRVPPRGTWIASAAIAVEIVSPQDETPEKLPFYAAHEVQELLIVDPSARSARWLALRGGEYRSVERSQALDLAGEDLTARIDWPPAE